MHKDFEQISHTADLQIRVWGKTKKEFFRNALIAMFQILGPKSPECKVVNERLECPVLSEQHTIEITSHDEVSLLVDFLSEAVYLSDIHNQAYLDADIHDLSETHIKATVHGINVTGFEVVEIKAVTYFDLVIKQVDGLWEADIVFDI